MRSPWNALANALERLGHALSTGEDMEHEGSGTTCSLHSRSPIYPGPRCLANTTISRTKVPGQYHHGQYHQPPRSWQLFNGGHQRGDLEKRNEIRSTKKSPSVGFASSCADHEQTGDASAPLKMKWLPATRRGAPTGNRPEKFGLPEWIARIGAILIEREADRRDRAPLGLSQSGSRCMAVASGEGFGARSDPAGPGAGRENNGQWPVSAKRRNWPRSKSAKTKPICSWC